MRRLIWLLFAAPLLYFCVSLAGAIVPGPSADLPPGNDIRIGLIRGTIHYDLMLPLDPALRAHFDFAGAIGVPIANPQAEWLIIGWGAKGFYTSASSYANVKAEAVWHAITGDTAVMRLDVAGDVSGLDDIDYITLSTKQYAAFLAQIDASFERDIAGAPIPIAAHLSQTDGFFAANDRFHLFHTCNNWISQTLRAAGLRFGAWTPTPQSVSISLWWNSH